MQITVIGAGNVGCIYGANLARIGQDVAMIDVWEEHVRRIQERGLDVDGLHGSFVARVAASTDPRAVPKSDVALICVNTYSTRDAANAARILQRNVYGWFVRVDRGIYGLSADGRAALGTFADAVAALAGRAALPRAAA